MFGEIASHIFSEAITSPTILMNYSACSVDKRLQRGNVDSVILLGNPARDAVV
jgi:hypothetical protein